MSIQPSRTMSPQSRATKMLQTSAAVIAGQARRWAAVFTTPPAVSAAIAIPKYSDGSTQSANRSDNGTSRNAASTNAVGATVAKSRARRDPLRTPIARPATAMIQNDADNDVPPGMLESASNRPP